MAGVCCQSLLKPGPAGQKETLTRDDELATSGVFLGSFNSWNLRCSLPQIISVGCQNLEQALSSSAASVPSCLRFVWTHLWAAVRTLSQLRCSRLCRDDNREDGAWQEDSVCKAAAVSRFPSSCLSVQGPKRTRPLALRFPEPPCSS